MLKNIDPLLFPELLKLLAEMGHDDALVLADANFTALQLAQGKPVLRLPGVGMQRAVQAIESVLPLVADVPHPVAFMQVSDSAPGYRSALQREVLAQLQPAFLPGQSAEALERYAFYEQVKGASLIVQSGEGTAYGNALFCKGVILV